MTQDTTPTSGAADLLELIEAYAEARQRQGHSSYNAQTSAALQAVKAALAAGQATAAQQGVAYAALPTSNYAGRVYEEGFLIGTCPLYTADQLRAFADATHTLRASHGQAPAGAAPACWIPPAREGEYHSSLTITAYREPMAGWEPLYRTHTAQAADSVQEDAALWHWLAEYLVGPRTDLDDEIVASETVNDLRKLVEAAIKQGEKK